MCYVLSHGFKSYVFFVIDYDTDDKSMEYPVLFLFFIFLKKIGASVFAFMNTKVVPALW